MKRSYGLKLVGAAGTLVLLALGSLCVGATETIGLSQVFDQLAQQRGVVYQFRLPRVLAAALVGLCFAVSGVLLQSLTRNPLASPDLIGVTSGGGLATVIAILIGGSQIGPHLPFIAFAGASLVAAIVWFLGRNASPQRFILTGVALAAFTQALVTFLLVTYAPSAAEAMIWLKGSLFGRSWVHLEHLLPWCVASSLGAYLCAHHVNPLLLGTESATSLGVRLSILRPLLWCLAVMAAAGAVAVAGTVGFVGLIVPHLARLLAGPDLRYHLPLAMVLGALFVLTADTLGRILAPPLEIPAGILCSFIGAPYFGYLLWKGQTRI